MRMRVGHADVHPQHLAEQRRRVLREVVGIVSGPAVAHPHVQVAVRTERQMTAVVVRKRLLDQRRRAGTVPAQVEARRRIGDERIRRAPEPRDDGMAVRVREVHEEAARQSGVRREREPEQPLLAAGPDRRRESRKSPGCTLPSRTTRMRPRCSTTNWTAISAGSCTMATGCEKPDACTRTRNCAAASVA